MQNQKNKKKSSTIGAKDAREALPNSEIKNLLNDLFSMGTGADIVLFLSEMYTCAQNSDGAYDWSVGRRVDIATTFHKLSRFVLRSEKFIEE